MERELEIYKYCENQWDIFEKEDKGYYPSKHDYKVFERAAKEFNITEDEAKLAFEKISEIVDDQQVKNMSLSQMINKFGEILKNNKDTPLR